MAKLPTYEEMAQEVARKALDECEYEGKTIREWIDIIKAQPVQDTDSISRRAAIEVAKSCWYKPDIAGELEKLPSAQPKRGKWIHDGSKWTNRWICSECGYKWFFDCIEGAYCPNCGAKMEGTYEID